MRTKAHCRTTQKVSLTLGTYSFSEMSTFIRHIFIRLMVC